MRSPLHVRFAGGFTLIEVLVALLVLTIGILGASATQLAALRSGHQSRLMSDGVRLAGLLADSMRANIEPMGAADPDNPYLQLRYDAATDGAPASAPQCLAGAGCGAIQMAEADIDQVRQALHERFPGGRVAVCRDSGAWGAGRGALRWACDGASRGAPIVIKLGWRGKETGGGAAPGVVIALPGVVE